MGSRFLSVIVVIIMALIQVFCASNKTFDCSNGLSINGSLVCNGKNDCGDFSDETFLLCYNNKCEEGEFRCNYGGCIKDQLQCDKINDCNDETDENKLACASEEELDKIMDEMKGTCGPGRALECRNGDNLKCVKWSEMCNGERDCDDGRDESLELCANSYCPEHSFRCADGGCISQEKFCNHAFDCADQSDEMDEICNKPSNKVDESTTIGEKPSVIPDQANVPKQEAEHAMTTRKPEVKIPIEKKHNMWKVPGCKLSYGTGIRVTDYVAEFSYKSNIIVPLNTVINIICEKGYQHFGPSTNKCMKDGKWKSPYFRCIRTCDQSSIVRNIRYSIECKNQGQLENCHDKTFLLNSEMSVTCAHGYQAMSSNQQGSHKCNNKGTWDLVVENPKCEPICGVYSKQHPDIKPWAVSIFKQVSENSYVWNCKGSIVSPYVVVTSAGCFDDEFVRDDYHIYFSVVEGDHKVSYDQHEDTGYQVHNVSNIHFASYNRGAHKVAILTLVKPFKFNPKVRPVCLDKTKYEISSGAISTDNIIEIDIGEDITENRNGLEYLTHIVHSNYAVYDIRAFTRPISDDIIKSEQIP